MTEKSSPSPFSSHTRARVSTGLDGLDVVLHGGLLAGRAYLVRGGPGTGKTQLALQFLRAGDGDALHITLGEHPDQLRADARNLGLEVEGIDFLDLSPSSEYFLEQESYDIFLPAEVERGPVTEAITERVEEEAGTLHVLGKYLVNRDVTLLFTDEIETITGDFKPTSSSISYVADNLLFLRYLEMEGELRKAIGVLKKRTSDFEKNLREFAITRYGIKVGEPLTGLRGILRGQPEWVGSASSSGDSPSDA